MVKPNIWIYLACIIAAILLTYVILEWRKGRPLIHNFKSSNVWKAFVLNSIVTTLIIFIAMSVKQQFDQANPKNVTNFKSVFLTLSATFVASMLAYSIMYAVFGFGGGMLIS